MGIKAATAKEFDMREASDRDAIRFYRNAHETCSYVDVEGVQMIVTEMRYDSDGIVTFIFMEV